MVGVCAQRLLFFVCAQVPSPLATGVLLCRATDPRLGR